MKENSISWELKTRPTENASPTHKKQVRIAERSETVRQRIAWRQDVIKVCVGLNATDLTSRRPIMEACMNQRVTSIVDEAHYDAGLEFCGKCPLFLAHKARNTSSWPHLLRFSPKITAFAQIRNGDDHNQLSSAGTMSANNSFPAKVVQQTHARWPN